jgi:hypothetical protein
MDELNGQPTICSRRSCRMHPKRAEGGEQESKGASEGAKNRNLWSIAAVERQQEPDRNPGG